MTTAPATSTGNITLADVRAALADTDPSTTNSGALRAILGRGSMATIQRHLDTLRAERAPAPIGAPGATPAAPADAVAVIWGAAWAQAQTLTLGRLEAVTAQRDTAQALAATLAQDVASLAGEVDALTDTVTASAGVTEVTAAQAAAELAKASAQAADQARALAAVTAELEHTKAEASHAAALAVRDAKIAEQLMQATIDRLTDQVSELKSLIHHPKAVK